MPRDFRLYLEDMLEAACWLREQAATQPADRYHSDKMFRDAVIRNLEIIGEAAKHIPDEIRSLSPDTNWRGITGLRDRAVHEYFGLHLETVRNIVNQMIPLLVSQIELLLTSLPW